MKQRGAAAVVFGAVSTIAVLGWGVPPASSSAEPAGSAQPWASGTPPPGGHGVNRTVAAAWEVSGGVKLHLKLPAGAQPQEMDLPTMDLSAVPDAKVVLRKGVARVVGAPEHVTDAVVAVCVTAGGGSWTPEIQPMVFDKMNDVTRSELAKAATIDRFEESPIVEQHGRFEQSVSGDGALAGAAVGKLKVRVEARHTLAFLGATPDVLACTVSCTELASESSRVCKTVMASLSIDGPFVSPPKPSLFARLLFALVRRPVAGAGAFFGCALMALGLLLAVWPARRATSPG